MEGWEDQLAKGTPFRHALAPEESLRPNAPPSQKRRQLAFLELADDFAVGGKVNHQSSDPGHKMDEGRRQRNYHQGPGAEQFAEARRRA